MSKGTVAVIGGGIIGLACARVLQRSGRQVTLFDPNLPGSGCSFGNAGLVALDHILPLSRPDVLLRVPSMLADRAAPLHVRWSSLLRLLPWLWRFAAAARPAQVARGTAVLATLLRNAVPSWNRLIADTALEPHFRRMGSLTIFESQKGLEAARRERLLLDRHGIRHEMLDGNQVRERVPSLAGVVAGGCYLHDAIHTIDPFEICQVISERIERDGGKIVTKAVHGFDLVDGQVAGVVLENDRLAADHYVIAAGTASVFLAKKLGMSIPLTSERGYHVMLDCPALADLPPIMFAERALAITPMARGIRAAGTAEFGAREPHWHRADILRSHVGELFGIDAPIEAKRWFGDRPTLPDYLPLIGRVPRHENVIVATGHQHLGFSLAPVTGEIVTDLVHGRTPSIQLDGLHVGRFVGAN